MSSSPPVRLMMYGGSHRVFSWIGAAVALRNITGTHEAEGASAGAIAGVVAVNDASVDVVRDYVAAFDLPSMFDRVPSESRKALSPDWLFGRAQGNALRENLHDLSVVLGCEKWESLRHAGRSDGSSVGGSNNAISDNAASENATGATKATSKQDNNIWSHRLGVRVSVLRLRGVSPEQAVELQARGQLAQVAFRNLITPRGIDLHKLETPLLPAEANAVGIDSDSFDQQFVADWLVNSARNPLAFMPLIDVDPTSGDATLILDGATPWSAELFRNKVPECPTIWLRYGSNQKQMKKFHDAYKNYFDLWLGDPDAKVFDTHNVNFMLDEQARLAYFDHGLNSVEKTFDHSAFREYVERHQEALELQRNYGEQLNIAISAGVAHGDKSCDKVGDKANAKSEAESYLYGLARQLSGKVSLSPAVREAAARQIAGGAARIARASNAAPWRHGHEEIATKSNDIELDAKSAAPEAIGLAIQGISIS